MLEFEKSGRVEAAREGSLMLYLGAVIELSTSWLNKRLLLLDSFIP